MLPTPEYFAAHLRDLRPEAGPKAEAIARHRHEAITLHRQQRRHRLTRLAAFTYRAVPFVNRAGETKVLPTESTPRTAPQ